ncbi:hypothetical protein CR513_30815, partial [Mucuna pruriens]
MFFGGSWRLLHLSLVMLLGVTVLQMWVCWHVEAVRAFPSNAMAKLKFSHGIENEKVKEDPLHKHFSGRTLGLSNGTQKGFDENKRRVPRSSDDHHQDYGSVILLHVAFHFLSKLGV